MYTIKTAAKAIIVNASGSCATRHFLMEMFCLSQTFSSCATPLTSFVLSWTFFLEQTATNISLATENNPYPIIAPIEEYDAGNYRFTNDGEILDDGLYYKGTIECCINSSGKIANFRDSMIKYTPYKKVDVISEKEAYDRLCAGKFYFPDYDKDEQLSDLVVKSVKISYTPDSKGYYRPVYEFVANANQDTGKREISIMVDAMEI